MGVTDYGRSGAAVRIGGTGLPPRFCGIGDGSGVFVASTGSMYSESGARVDYTGSIDFGTQNQFKFQFDYGSMQVSGLVLREVGVSSGSVAGVQDNWLREHFTGLEFDGTNELIIDVIFQTY